MPSVSTRVACRSRHFLRHLCLLAVVLLGCQALAIAQTLPGSGNSLGFNGANSYVNCGTSNRGITQQVTVEAWIKTSSNAYQWVVGKYYNSLFEEKGFHLYVIGGTAGFNGRIGVGTYMSSGLSTTRVDDGKWHHLAGVCNYSTWQIYVDGVLESTGTYTAFQSDLTTSTSMVIGCYDVQSGQYFSGDIDEVRVWRTVRTPADIRDNMCRKLATVPSALVAYYRFDQSSGSAAVDNGSVPTNGTLLNIGSAGLWHYSGAPLGDASVAQYQTVWPAGTRLSIGTASGDSAIVTAVLGPVRGVQLYAVNAPPSVQPAGPVAPTYVGVFTTTTTAPATGVYTLALRPASGPSCRNAFVRQGNDYAWTLQPQLPSTATQLLVGNVTYRSEHILTTGTALTASITGDSVLCAGRTTQLAAVVGAGVTVAWSTGATTPTLANVGPGTYTLTVTSSAGCSRVLRRTVRALAAPGLAITGDSVVCPGVGTSLTAAAAGATAYLWSTGNTSATAPIAQPGTYTVTATYGSGCTVTARRTVRLNGAGVAPVFTLGADTTICDGEQVVLRGPVGAALRYQWSDGSTARQLAVQAAGRYTLRVLTACGEQSATRAVAVASCLKVPNVVTANGDKKNDFFAVQGLKGDGWALDVYNRWGRNVFQTANYRNDWGGDAAPGLYYVLLRRPATGYLYKGWVEVLR